MTSSQAGNKTLPWDLDTIAFIFLATLIGAYIRLAPVLSSDFPLNDGALFSAMVRDLQNAGYLLPKFANFNSNQIPFAYPPFGFYFAGLLVDIINLDLFDVVRILPAVFSVLTIPAFYLLARAMLKSASMAVIAVFAFALLPRSFEWLIMGGGLSRAPGFFFSILAIYCAFLMYTRLPKKYVFYTAIFFGLTTLSHPEMAWNVLVTIGIFFLFVNHSRKALLKTLFVGIGVLFITSPWWLSLVLSHGLTPLIAGFRSGYGAYLIIGPFLKLNFGDELFLPLVSLLGLLGFFICVFKKQFLLPFWLLSIFVLSPRGGGTNSTLPLSMLAGIGMDLIVTASTNLISPSTSPQIGGTGQNISGIDKLFQNRFSKWFIGFFIIYLLFAALMLPVFRPETLEAISIEEREAMYWVGDNTSGESKFLVITSLESYGVDGVSEWFPYITDRENLILVQGSEWVPGSHSSMWLSYLEAQRCANEEKTCLDDWADAHNESFTHVYISKYLPGGAESYKGLIISLNNSDEYTLIYDTESVAIFERKLMEE